MVVYDVRSEQSQRERERGKLRTSSVDLLVYVCWDSEDLRSCGELIERLC